jgi:hypothetical protein
VAALRFFDNFFHLADFLLDFPGNLLANTLAFQVGVVREFAHLFLDGALHFVNPACDLIFSAWLHLVTSFETISIPTLGQSAFDFSALPAGGQPLN